MLFGKGKANTRGVLRLVRLPPNGCGTHLHTWTVHILVLCTDWHLEDDVDGGSIPGIWHVDLMSFFEKKKSNKWFNGGGNTWRSNRSEGARISRFPARGGGFEGEGGSVVLFLFFLREFFYRVFLNRNEVFKCRRKICWIFFFLSFLWWGSSPTLGTGLPEKSLSIDCEEFKWMKGLAVPAFVGEVKSLSRVFLLYTTSNICVNKIIMFG